MARLWPSHFTQVLRRATCNRLSYGIQVQVQENVQVRSIQSNCRVCTLGSSVCTALFGRSTAEVRLQHPMVLGDVETWWRPTEAISPTNLERAERLPGGCGVGACGVPKEWFCLWGGLCHPHPDSALTQIANIMFDAFQIEACLFSKDPPGSQFSFRPVGNPRRSGIMQDAGPDDTTRLVTIFLGANDASLLEENPKQHVSWL